MLNFWVGVASIIVSVFAVIILYLTRANILDILDKDVILFDKNFELKKNAIDSALQLIDEVDEKGKCYVLRPEVSQKAKAIYNDLLCVTSDVRVADEFYNIVIDENVEVTETRLAQFKLMCRQDIGLKTKKAKAVKRILEKQSASKEKEPANFSSFKTNDTPISRPSETLNTQQVRPQPMVRPEQFTQPTASNHLGSNSIQQSRPVVARPAPQPKPITNVATPAKTAEQPAKKVGRPKKSN